MGIAVVYATGLTKGIQPLAKYIAGRAGADSFNLKDLMKLNLKSYDTVVIGTAMHAGAPDKLVSRFMEDNAEVLSEKKLRLFVQCKNSDEKTEQECRTVADSLGIPDAVCFGKKAENMNPSGFPAAVDDFIAELGA